MSIYIHILECILFDLCFITTIQISYFNFARTVGEIWKSNLPGDYRYLSCSAFRLPAKIRFFDFDVETGWFNNMKSIFCKTNLNGICTNPYMFCHDTLLIRPNVPLESAIDGAEL